MISPALVSSWKHLENSISNDHELNYRRLKAGGSDGLLPA
jgi:hypothetical protein